MRRTLPGPAQHARTASAERRSVAPAGRAGYSPDVEPRRLVAETLGLAAALGLAAWATAGPLVGGAREVGARLGALAAAAAPPGRPPAASAGRAPLPSAGSAEPPEPSARDRQPARRSGKRVRRSVDAHPSPLALHLDAARVLSLAAARRVPTARRLAATEGRPAGLELQGVSALGVGLTDGDVLVEVEGRPVTTEAQVVSLVIAARARRAPTVSGRLLRGEREVWLVVDQPYPTGEPRGGSARGAPATAPVSAPKSRAASSEAGSLAAYSPR